MTYNLTSLYNTTDYGEYISLLDAESGNILGLTLLAVTALIFIITFYKEGIGTGMAASGFITTIIAILMFVTGFLKPHFIIYPVLLFAGGLIAKKLGGGA